MSATFSAVVCVAIGGAGVGGVGVPTAYYYCYYHRRNEPAFTLFIILSYILFIYFTLFPRRASYCLSFGSSPA